MFGTGDLVYTPSFSLNIDNIPGRQAFCATKAKTKDFITLGWSEITLSLLIAFILQRFQFC